MIAPIQSPDIPAVLRLPSRSWSRRNVLAAVAAAIAGAGCGLQRASLPQRTFLLQAPATDPARDATPPAGVLFVRPVRVAPAFDSRAFIIRRGESEYATDAYHGFLLSPGPMFTDAIA